MKTSMVILSIFIFLCTSMSGDNLRNAADFFELLLIEEFNKMALLTASEEDFSIEQLKKISDDLHQRYGFITSYQSYEIEEKKVTFNIQMEYAKLLVIVNFNDEGKIIGLEYQPLEEIRLEKSKIFINTTPAKASVYVNGVFYGWSPIVLEDYPGVYYLEIQKNGFLSLSQTLQLNNKDEVDFTFQLMPAVKIHQLDYMEAKSVLLNSFDRGGWYKADWVSENITQLTLSDENVTQGTRTLKTDFYLEQPSEVIIQYPYSIESRNLEGARIFFIDVYLDYEGEAIFSLALQAGEQWQWIESETIKLKKGMNYSLPIRFTNNEDISAVKVLNLKLYIPQPESSGSIYYDNLRYYEEISQTDAPKKGVSEKK